MRTAASDELARLKGDARRAFAATTSEAEAGGEPAIVPSRQVPIDRGGRSPSSQGPSVAPRLWTQARSIDARIGEKVLWIFRSGRVRLRY